MDHEHFYHGNYEEEAREVKSKDPPKDKWWVFGHFMQEGHSKTTAMGLKYWKYNKGEEARTNKKTVSLCQPSVL